MTLYSTIVGVEDSSFRGGVFNKQLIFVFIGFIIYFLISRFDFRFIKYPQVVIPFYILVILSLVYVIFFGVVINGAKRWVIIAGSQLQPSEFAKLATIFLTACLCSMKDRLNIWFLAALSLGLTAVCAFLIFIEPDLSTAVVTMMTVLFMVITVLPDHIRTLILLSIVLLSLVLSLSFLNVGLQFWHVFLLLVLIILFVIFILKYRNQWYLSLIFLILGIIGSFTLKITWDKVLDDYQKSRITCFLDPENDTSGACFQINQSIVAIGSGMVYGKGLGHGTQSKLQFLPEHQTDFIFASFAEEFGLLGSMILLALYLYLILSIIRSSTKTNDYFGALVCVGVGVKLLIEVFVNIGMNLGALPTTGIPLPLMSSGGSIFITTMISLGLVQSITVFGSEDVDDVV